MEVGQQAVIRISIHNNNARTAESFVLLVEVRDGIGVTEFLAWQSGTVEANADYQMEISWTPRDMCTYYEGCEDREIRSFAITSMSQPQILSPVFATGGITVTGSVPKAPFIQYHYDVTINNRAYDIGYSFSEGGGRLVNVEVDNDARTMLLSLANAQDSRFTIMMPRGLFNHVFIGDTSDAVGLYASIGGVEVPFDQVIDSDNNTVTYVLSIERETAQIELGGKVGFESQFLGYFGSQIISLDMALVEQNDTENVRQMDRIAKSFDSCDRRLVYIGYGLGSMRVAVVGLDWQEQCIVAIAYEIEMGGEKLDCSVPVQTLSSWSGWKNADVPQLEEISNYCE